MGPKENILAMVAVYFYPMENSLTMGPKENSLVMDAVWAFNFSKIRKKESDFWYD